ncbi:hypothetical protein evm_006018 [Chilo suppressalis]|nr:hypothetical protein evm_006018 [Chilo suppressalis]
MAFKIFCILLAAWPLASACLGQDFKWPWKMNNPSRFPVPWPPTNGQPQYVPWLPTNGQPPYVQQPYVQPPYYIQPPSGQIRYGGGVNKVIVNQHAER